jgi:hypothetical protein
MIQKFYRYDQDGSKIEYNRTRFISFLCVNYGKKEMEKVLREFDNETRTKFIYRYGYFLTN